MTFTALIHGLAGVGKSRLTDTMPAPRLILDTEGRSRFLPSRKVWWDPLHDAPPVNDGSWETCVVTAHNMAVTQQAFTWLRSGQHPFVSAGVDSMMMAQKRIIDDVAGLNQLREQDWGTVLRRTEGIVRDWTDLRLERSTGIQTVVFTVGTRERSGKYEPLLQGQLRDTIPYFFDTVGYLFVTNDPETGATSRGLLIWPQANFLAKDNTDALPGPIIVDPRIDRMVELMQQSAPKEGEVSA